MLALAFFSLPVVPGYRELAGSLYEEALARQLASFLLAPLRQAGGLLLLPDAWVRVNRARGTGQCEGFHQVCGDIPRDKATPGFWSGVHSARRRGGTPWAPS